MIITFLFAKADIIIAPKVIFYIVSINVTILKLIPYIVMAQVNFSSPIIFFTIIR